MTDRRKKFDALAKQAAGCQLCPRMVDRSAVLGHANGRISAPIVFIAEAPGRLGAGRTGIPFHGDKSGENFETLLSSIGLTRNDVFITNAVLCNPLQDGANSRPQSLEISNCSYFLKATLDLIKPNVVVTLGGVALDSVNQLLGTRIELAKAVAQPQTAPSFIWLPLYHPSPRVANWKRPLEQQKRDFQKILKIVVSNRQQKNKKVS